MIELKNLQPLPEAEQNTPRREISPQDLTDLTRRKIDKIVERVLRPNRIKLTGEGDETYLMNLNRDTPGLSYVVGLDDKIVVGNISSALMQNIVINIMREYGLNESIHAPSDRLIGLTSEKTGVQSLIYPSQKIPGLAFCRVIIYPKVGGPEYPYVVHWYAQDIASPLRIKGKDILPPNHRKLQPKFEGTSRKYLP